jgi:hypothetical protein
MYLIKIKIKNAPLKFNTKSVKQMPFYTFVFCAYELMQI